MVSVDSGEFKLMRNVNVEHQPSRSKVYSAWIRAFSYQVPDAINHLADVIEDIYTYELWKDNYLDTPEQLLERFGIFGLNLDDPAKLIRDLRKKKSKKKDEILARCEKAKALRESGMTQQQIAKELGVDQSTVNRDLCKKEARADILHKDKRHQIRYAIYQGTDPAQAAKKIIETFGEHFAACLAKELELAL